MSIEQRRRTRSRLALLATAILVVLAVAGTLANRMAYGTFAWWAEPDRIAWCGRTYYPSGAVTLTRADVERQRAYLPGDTPYPVVEVARVPPLIGRPVLASVTPAERRERLRVPCAMALYHQIGPDSFRPYTISGGP